MNSIIDPSPVFLNRDGQLMREPEKPELLRPEGFWPDFDRYTLFYDAFRDADGKRIWLVGPEPRNLLTKLENSRIRGVQSGQSARPNLIKGHESIAAYIELPPSDCQFIWEIDGQEIQGEIGQNHCDRFKDERVLLTLNKDNDLAWIRDWAEFYVKAHGATAICIFDNGSSDYDAEGLLRSLDKVAGISTVQIVQWPYIFGVMDKVGQEAGLNQNVRFAQPPMYPSFLLRFGKNAASILNVDIDELVISISGKSIFSEAERRVFGNVKFDRYLVENVHHGKADKCKTDFLKYQFRDRSRLGRQDHLRKWAIAPKKLRLTKKAPMPWTHRVYGALNPYPAAREFKCYHFAGINTGWRAKTHKGEKPEWQHKRHFAEPYDPNKHVKDEFLASKLQEIFGRDDE